MTGNPRRLPACQWHTPITCVSASTRNSRASPSGNANFLGANAAPIVCACPFLSQGCGSKFRSCGSIASLYFRFALVANLPALASHLELVREILVSLPFTYVRTSETGETIFTNSHISRQNGFHSRQLQLPPAHDPPFHAQCQLHSLLGLRLRYGRNFFPRLPRTLDRSICQLRVGAFAQ